jgi:hypothetical protein
LSAEEQAAKQLSISRADKITAINFFIIKLSFLKTKKVPSDTVGIKRDELTFYPRFHPD